MTTSLLSYNFSRLHHIKPTKTSQTHAFDPLCHIQISRNHDKSSFFGNRSFQSYQIYQKPANEQRLRRDFVVYDGTPDAAASLLSFLPTDNPWFAWVGCLMVALPFAIQRLISFTNQVEIVAETIESIADTVGNVAAEIDKAADDLVEKLPDGKLKDLVDKVDDMAEATVNEAQKVEDLMDKVEEMSNKVEDFIVENAKKKV